MSYKFAFIVLPLAELSRSGTLLMHVFCFLVLTFNLCHALCINLQSLLSVASSVNDSDPDEGDSLTICDGGVADSSGALVPVGGGPRQMPEGGTLSISSDGCYTFSTSNGDFESLGVGETAEVCFTYLVCDVVGASASAEVCIEITGENDPPVAEDDSYRVTADDPTVASNIIAPNDSDPETDKLTIVGFDKGDGTGPIINPSSTFSVSFPSGGEMTVNPETGGMTYSASPYADGLRDGETFVETATYTISDGNGGTDVATVTIVVVGDLDPPIAEDNSYARTVDQLKADGGTITGQILENDSDPDGALGDLVITEVTPNGPGGGTPQSIDPDTGLVTIALDNGSATLNPITGEVVYTPNSDKVAALGPGSQITDIFTYVITDKDGGTDIATVTFTVVGQNDPPVPEDDSETVPEGDDVSDCVL